MGKVVKKVPRRNENAHANCRNKPCPYCAALRKADAAFAGQEPDSIEERLDGGHRTGPYAG